MAKALLVRQDTKELEKSSPSGITWTTRTRRPHDLSVCLPEFAMLVFQDELGEDLAKAMLKVWYFCRRDCSRW